MAESTNDKRYKPTRFHGPIEQEFLDQAAAYNFRFLCEDCGLFNEETGLCVHSYPNEPHRKAYFDDEPLGKTLIFCREFELE